MIEHMTSLPVWLQTLLLIISILLGGWIIHRSVFYVLGLLVRRWDSGFLMFFVQRGRRSTFVLTILVIAAAVHNAVPLYHPVAALLDHILRPLLMLAFGWLSMRFVTVAEDMVLRQYQVNETDNLRARRVITQTTFLKKIAIGGIAVLTLGLILMTFETVRQLGTSILASAGVVGLVVGLAAQRYIGNLLAGLQIAFTQPIRLDDVVIVENEWGKIEEIALTYVVVQIWDLRRLVVPISYFIEKPFQNWTRVTSDLLGSVFLYLDYTVPIQPIRDELTRILEKTPEWDGKTCVVQVTNTTERSMEVRALMSSSDASKLWTLRCVVREKLIDYIQKQYPRCLPRIRTEIFRSGLDDNETGIIPLDSGKE